MLSCSFLYASRFSTPLPVATPVTAQHGYEYVLPPLPTSKSFTNGTTTPPKSPNLAAHQHIRSSLNPSASSPTFHTSSSSLAKRFAPLKHLLFKRFGFVTKRFDIDFGDMRNQTVVSISIKLHPLDLLMRISPLVFVQCLFYAWDRAAVHKGPGLEGWSQQSANVLLLIGTIAFLLNIVSLTANQKNGPLTMTVAANLKQVVTILLAMYMFHPTITPADTIGIALTLAGGAWYGALDYEEKKNRLRMV
ncbi:UAA transporter [Tulasnella sp. UAMH 9824]|nr:UAA transporter [Tulasnella sp. UAMH 9824]